MMSSNEMTEINRYCSPYSLLVLTPKKLIRMYCPFNVEAVSNANGILKGNIYRVMKVQIYTDRRMIYVIDNATYMYHLFKILL